MHLRKAVFSEWTMVRAEIVYDRETESFADVQGQNVRTQ